MRLHNGMLIGDSEKQCFICRILNIKLVQTGLDKFRIVRVDFYVFVSINKLTELIVRVVSLKRICSS